MKYSRIDFKKGKCPKCGSSDIKKERNIINTGFLDGVGYFLNFPLDPNYYCNKCDARNDKDDCFIATAVYGDRNAPQVNILREYRDDVLRESLVGRAAIGLYYSGAGKRTAEFIKKHLPSTIPIICKGLDVLVEKYSTQRM